MKVGLNLRNIIFLCACLLAVACQIKPTKTFQTVDSIQSVHQNLSDYLSRKPVILDTRTPFDYNLSHVPGAVGIQWQDFSDTNPGKRGYLHKDRFALARRLSLIGISPESPVLVIGYGPQKGQGQEGRIAWMLTQLGVKDVRTIAEGELRALNPREEMPPKNVPYWKPADKDEGEIDLNLLRMITSKEPPRVRVMTKARAAALQIPREASLNMRMERLFGETVEEWRNKVMILDVRETFKTSQEPLDKMLETSRPVQAKVWREFYNSKGEVVFPTKNWSFAKSDFILVMGDHGVESAATVFALRSIGYTRVLHFAGGVEELRLRP